MRDKDLATHRPSEQDDPLNGVNVVLNPTSDDESLYDVPMVTDPLTGLSMLNFGPNAPVLTSEEVADFLSKFP